MQTNKIRKAQQIILNTHQEDPEKVLFEENEVGAEYLYSIRMNQILKEYSPSADWVLELAALCHHLKRWEIARSEFPMDKQGYFQWRKQVAKHQLNLTEALLIAAGLSDAEINKVVDILKKENIKRKPESQIIEDVACLVFVQYYLEDFAKLHNNDKVVDILYKSMLKMSANGIAFVAKLNLSEAVKAFVFKATELFQSNIEK